VAYTIVRKGGGVIVDRFKGYRYENLAYNFRHREMEPMLVNLEPDDEIPALVVHAGQEFNLVLQGRMRITIREHSFVLEAGDSIYFDATLPHSQSAVHIPTQFLTVINEASVIQVIGEE
jgi:mannose-6-phosphate isomerase-like protein (cupin superfamily)